MKTLLFRFIGVALFVYIILKIDFSALVNVFWGMRWQYYAMGLLFLAVWFLMRTFKWKILINSLGIKISDNQLFVIMAKGVFWGIVTPGKLGEFWRAKYLSQATGIPQGKTMYTAFMDRLVDMLVSVLVAILGLSVIYFQFNLQMQWQFYILGLAILLGFFLIILKKMGVQRVARLFTKFFIPRRWHDKTNNFLAEFDGGMAALSPKIFLALLAFGLLYYLSATFVYYFTALALGLSVPFWYMFFTIAIVWLILTLPISFFGLGAREAGFIYFFSLIGISAPSAVAFSLLALFSNLLMAIPGALFFLKR